MVFGARARSDAFGGWAKSAAASAAATFAKKTFLRLELGVFLFLQTHYSWTVFSKAGSFESLGTFFSRLKDVGFFHSNTCF